MSVHIETAAGGTGPSPDSGGDNASAAVLGGTTGAIIAPAAFAIQDASLELLEIADFAMTATVRYLKSRGIVMVPESDYAVAAVTVGRIVDVGNGRFDFAIGDQGESALICEALDWDAETVVDLVAWPLGKPDRVMTMFGRCALLGMFEALNPATYVFGHPLKIHRTPEDYMQSGFRGAAIVTPHRAARVFLDIPGDLAGQDVVHGRELQRLIDQHRKRVVVPARGRAA